MKLSAILGALALSALEASASPVDKRLEGNLGSCCTEISTAKGRFAVDKNIPTGNLRYSFNFKGCEVVIKKTNPYLCSHWNWEFGAGCESDMKGSFQDDSVCK
ncbi:hypothetical protein E4U55_001702 [Claviceps digitariae]|nr:hypothetical protein E4U55_001702 [Claviceps digitariae]